MIGLDDYVVTGWHVGRVTKAGARMGGARGYHVRDVFPIDHRLDGWLPRFCPDQLVHEAVIGENICPHPGGTHSCGKIHVPQELLAAVERQAKRKAGTT